MMVKSWEGANVMIVNSMKKLTLTGYHVEYVDLRESKPRPHHIKTVVYDADMIRATEMLGLMVTDCIEKRFADGGYKVIQIVKAGQKVIASVDLEYLYQQSDGGGF